MITARGKKSSLWALLAMAGAYEYIVSNTTEYLIIACQPANVVITDQAILLVLLPLISPVSLPADHAEIPRQSRAGTTCVVGFGKTRHD